MLVFSVQTRYSDDVLTVRLSASITIIAIVSFNVPLTWVQNLGVFRLDPVERGVVAGGKIVIWRHVISYDKEVTFAQSPTRLPARQVQAARERQGFTHITWRENTPRRKGCTKKSTSMVIHPYALWKHKTLTW